MPISLDLFKGEAYNMHEEYRRRSPHKILGILCVYLVFFFSISFLVVFSQCELALACLRVVRVNLRVPVWHFYGVQPVTAVGGLNITMEPFFRFHHSRPSVRYMSVIDVNLEFEELTKKTD